MKQVYKEAAKEVALSVVVSGINSSLFAYGQTSSGKTYTMDGVHNFVELVGSERASQALSAGARLKEGCQINRSTLLTLGAVIRNLSKGRTRHVPYRDSKITRILQPSLGDNARTCMLSNQVIPLRRSQLVPLSVLDATLIKLGRGTPKEPVKILLRRLLQGNLMQ